MKDQSAGLMTVNIGLNPEIFRWKFEMIIFSCEIQMELLHPQWPAWGATERSDKLVAVNQDSESGFLIL